MTITRMQEPRQMYQQGGIMQVAPRQGYFVGKLVKSIGKGVKKFVKSDLGKAALLGAAAFGIPGTQFGGLLGRASLGGAAPSIFGKTGGISALFGGGANPLAAGFKGMAPKKGFLGMAKKVLGSTAGQIGIGTALSALAASGLGEEEIEAVKRDPDKLKIYLKDYYSKLNPNASGEEIDAFVETNVSEYVPKATGGRVGFAEGMNMMMASAPDPADSLNDLSQMLFGKNLDELTDDEYEALQEKARDTLAIGGRVGLESGTPKKGLESLSKEDIEKFRITLPNKIEYDKDGNRIKPKIPRTKGPAKFDPDRDIKRLLLKNKLAMGGMPTGIMKTNQAGIIERDYRETGGFVPVGIKEKADDVPAMLSKNEFVMTADAVRGMGDGSIEKGAQKLYDQMKRLENKVA